MYRIIKTNKTQLLLINKNLLSSKSTSISKKIYTSYQSNNDNSNKNNNKNNTKKDIIISNFNRSYEKKSKYDIESNLLKFNDNNNLLNLWKLNNNSYYLLNKYNIINLNSQLINYNIKRTINDKYKLLSELTLSYYIRFHQLILQEYKFDKNIIEKRLKTFSNKQLQKEGYSLFHMNILYKGNLLNDKIYRFYCDNYTELSYNQFKNGDSIRISLNGMQTSITQSFEGVVLVS